MDVTSRRLLRKRDGACPLVDRKNLEVLRVQDEGDLGVRGGKLELALPGGAVEIQVQSETNLGYLGRLRRMQPTAPCPPADLGQSGGTKPGTK